MAIGGVNRTSDSITNTTVIFVADGCPGGEITMEKPFINHIFIGLRGTDFKGPNCWFVSPRGASRDARTDIMCYVITNAIDDVPGCGGASPSIYTSFFTGIYITLENRGWESIAYSLFVISLIPQRLKHHVFALRNLLHPPTPSVQFVSRASAFYQSISLPSPLPRVLLRRAANPPPSASTAHHCPACSRYVFA